MDTVGLVLVRSVILAVALASLFAGMTVIERKVLGYFHLRLGPTRTGPWGLLQPLADAIKAIVKEDIIPRDADRLVFRLAPIISVFTALAAWSVIPVGPPVEVGGVTVPLAVADPPGGVLVAVAFTALSVYGVTLAGWSSQSNVFAAGGHAGRGAAHQLRAGAGHERLGRHDAGRLAALVGYRGCAGG